VLIGCVGMAVGVMLGPGSANAVGAHSVAHGSSHYTVGLFGDMPYGDAAKAQYPNLLADLNAHDLAFSAFDGDLKAGGDATCSNDLYARQLSAFNSLRAPPAGTPRSAPRVRDVSYNQRVVRVRLSGKRGAFRQ
jgi:hypothetical protein